MDGDYKERVGYYGDNAQDVFYVMEVFPGAPHLHAAARAMVDITYGNLLRQGATAEAAARLVPEAAVAAAHLAAKPASEHYLVAVQGVADLTHPMQVTGFVKYADYTPKKPTQSNPRGLPYPIINTLETPSTPMGADRFSVQAAALAFHALSRANPAVKVAAYARYDDGVARQFYERLGFSLGWDARLRKLGRAAAQPEMTVQYVIGEARPVQQALQVFLAAYE